MKNIIILISTIFLSSSLISTDMPPMPPMLMNDVANTATDKRTMEKKPTKEKSPFQNKLSSIPACGALPPMIIFLPPPMEKSLVSCRNEYYKPSMKDASGKISKYYKKTLRVTKIKIVDGFREVYKISIQDKKKKYFRYCNKDLNACLKY